MKLALLLCAKPTTNFVGHSVYVPKGNWKVVTEDLVNTEFHLVITTPVPHGFPCLTSSKLPSDIIEGEHNATVHISKAGTERQINIFLETI